MVRVFSISCLIHIVVVFSFHNNFEEDIPKGVAGFRSHIQPFIQSSCLSCHDDAKRKGGLSLSKLSGEFTSDSDIETWELILEMVESGEMPPQEDLKPSQNEREAIVHWIENELRQSATQKTHRPTTARRLTNFEYQNTMRDLLGFELDLIEQLPNDPAKPYRFNNTANFMRMGPEQIDRYLECARRAMASAIVDPAKPKVHKTRRDWQAHGIERGLGGDEVAIWGNRRNTPGTGMGLKAFPKTGEFRIRMQASAILPEGINEMPLRLVMGYGLNVNSSTQQMEPVGTVTLKNNPDHPEIFEFRGRIENYPVQKGVTRKNKKQPDSLVITAQNLYDDGTLNDENLFLYWPRKLSMPRAVVNWIEFEAPLTETWPPTHHTQILFDSPLRQNEPDQYLRQVLERFVSRAFRRPATASEIDRFVQIFNLVQPELNSFEEAIRETLSMVLISPQFLYHTVEQDNVTSGQFELASRLSYFLWGSMPDDELLELARQNQLNQSAVLKQQVSRMISDERFDDAIENFAMQWLSLDKMKTVPINRDLFPRFLYYVPRGERAGTEEPYRPTIRDYMLDETIGFVVELIRQNRSTRTIVDSDFAFLNQPLAAHYGIDGVEGHELRPVPVKPDHHLGGLLTHGSVLIGNGTGSAPHPIYRAVWLREAILGDEVAPPPADVPALSDSAGDSAEKALNIKDLLAAHRKKESCNDCHARLDPWGIPFERYNAVGKFQPNVPEEGKRVEGFNRQKHKDLEGYLAYRKSIFTQPVDASTKLPNGIEVDGLEELKSYLIEQKSDAIAENILRRFLTYSLGRELEWQDRDAIKLLIDESKTKDYRMKEMIIAICLSDLFRGETSVDEDRDRSNDAAEQSLELNQ